MNAQIYSCPASEFRLKDTSARPTRRFAQLDRVFVLTVVVSLIVYSSLLEAATFYATSINDAGPGSLRQAIVDANILGGGTISIPTAGTITLASSLPPLTNISILGEGTNVMTIRGTNTDSVSLSFTTNGFRVFEIPLNSTCALQGITIAHGYGSFPGGGAILNSGTLTLTTCSIVSNIARFGGGIYSSGGSLTLRQCVFRNNTARGASSGFTAPIAGQPVEGGAICLTGGVLRIFDGFFDHNFVAGGSGLSAGNFGPPPTPGGAGAGGAVAVLNGTVTISNSVFSFNSARGGSSGGWYAGGGGGFPGTSGLGGALHVLGSAQVIACSFLTNATYGGHGGGSGGGGTSGGAGGGAEGGAVSLKNGTAFFTDCSFVGNRATAGTGGQLARSGFGGSGGTARGAALRALNTSLSLFNLTISHNTASGGNGGVYGGGSMWSGQAGNGGDAHGSGIALSSSPSAAVNVTISANTTIPGQADNRGGGSSGFDGRTFGAGLWADGNAYLTNLTVVLNTATSGTGGGIHGPVSLRNCLLSANTATNGPDASGIVSLGYNLFGNSSGLTGFLGLDLLDVDAQIGPLQDNGGSTMTHALLAGSPAIDRGDSGGTTTDQRGLRRPIDNPTIANAANADDIGALESDPVLRITQIKVAATNILLGFSTSSDGIYRIDHKDNLETTNWFPAAASLPGTGGIVKRLLGSDEKVHRFYRVVREN